MRPRLRITTRDDRGQEFPLWQLPGWRWGGGSGLGSGRAGESDVPEYVRARLQSDLIYTVKSFTIYSVAVVVLFQIVFMSVAISLGGIRGFGGAMAAVMIGFVLVQQRLARNKTAAATRATLLAECHCPSCGYDLLDVPVDAKTGDGCTVCPECQSAWRLDPSRSLRQSPAAALAAPHTNIGEPGYPEGGSPAKPPTTIRESIRWFLGLQQYHRWRGFLAGADDRGKVVEIASARVRVRPPREWPSVPEEAQKRIRSELWNLGLGRRVAAGVIGLPLVLFFIVMMLWLQRRGAPMTLIRLFPVLMYAFFAIMLVRFVMHPYVRRPRQVAEIFLREGRCPSCATDLLQPAIEPESDGCIVCPNCHAAWKLLPAALVA